MITELQHAGFSLGLSPEQGGCVAWFRQGDRDVLRPGPAPSPEKWDARDFAAFPMVPFIGRIVHGKMSGPAGPVHLPPNMPPEPHAIHGYGWQSAWQVTEQSDMSATLTHNHDGSIWPWAYHSRQTFTLTESGLSLVMSLTNKGLSPMPAGLGWHPYFPRQGARLTASTEAVWMVDDNTYESNPYEPTASNDLRNGPKVDDLRLDHAFDVSTHQSIVVYEDVRVSMTAAPVFSKMVIYVPPGEDFFCAEPTTHIPNAINMDLPADVTGRRDLAPGETLEGRIELTVTPRG